MELAGSRTDAIDLVQLGNVQISRATLCGPGAPLFSALADFAPIHGAAELAGLPTNGWRLVSTRSPLGPVGRRATFVAPHGEARDRWVMLGLVLRDGSWWVSQVASDPLQVRPGKAARREGLRLVWCKQPIVGVAGEQLRLLIGLRNISDQQWSTGHGEDGVEPDKLEAIAWLHDSTGRQLPARTAFVTSGPGPTTLINPGDTIMLSAQLMTIDPERLPPGNYQLSALLPSLGLESERGSLHLAARGSR